MNKQLMEELKKKNKQFEEELKKKNKQFEEELKKKNEQIGEELKKENKRLEEKELEYKRREEFKKLYNEEYRELSRKEYENQPPHSVSRQPQYALRYVKVLKDMLENLQLKGVEFFFVRITDNGHVEKEEILGIAKTEAERDESMKKGLSYTTERRKREEKKAPEHRCITYDCWTGQPKIRLFKYLKEEIKGGDNYDPKDLDEKGNLSEEYKRKEFQHDLEGTLRSEEIARYRMYFLGESLKEIPFIELAYMWVRSCDKPPRIGYYDLEMLIGVRGVLPNAGESIYNYINTYFSQERFPIESKFYGNYSFCCEYIKSREDLEKRLYTAEFLNYLCLRNHAMYKYVSSITKKSDFEKFYYPFNEFMDVYISDRIIFFEKKFEELSVNEVLERSKDLNVKLEVDSKGNFLIRLLELFMKLQKLYINNVDEKVYQEVIGEETVYIEYMSLDNLLKKIKEIFFKLKEDELLSSQLEYVSINEILLIDVEEFFDKLKEHPEVYLPFKEFSGKEIIKVSV